MFKRIGIALVLTLVLSAVALPTLASQGGGGVHFGPYSLSSEDVVTGDLVVFGPVTLGEGSTFDGDLVAFGEVDVEEDALVTGDLTCFGATYVAGIVEGSVVTAGQVELADSAEVEGDVNAMGAISRTDGAVVGGRVNENTNFGWDLPFIAPFVFGPGHARPLWQQGIGELLQGLATVVVLALFALVIAAVWPTEMERVGRVIVEEPLPSFGIGALALLIAFVGVLILALTICLSPLALAAGAVVAVGLVLGWAALGAVLGERLLRHVFRARHISPLGAAALGTTVLTLLAVLLDLLPGCLDTLLTFPQLAVAGGAGTVKRVGTIA